MTRIPSHTTEDAPKAFAYLGLSVFTAYFLNYAETELDVPAGQEVNAVATGRGNG